MGWSQWSGVSEIVKFCEVFCRAADATQQGPVAEKDERNRKTWHGPDGRQRASWTGRLA